MKNMSAKLVCMVTVTCLFGGLFLPSALVSQAQAEESGNTNLVILEENFDGYESGSLPANWISDVNKGSLPFTVVQDNGDGRLTFDGNAYGNQSLVMVPVEWDNYIIEADVRFDSFLNAGSGASIMFRASSDGKAPYSQMTIKQNGTIETAYRNSDGSWLYPTPISATGSPLLENTDYTMQVRVFDRNVKMYLKAKDDTSFTLYADQNLTVDELPETGMIGFQGDQSKVSFDNLKVTRLTADQLELTVPGTLEALSGATSVTGSVNFSDGMTEEVPSERVELHSSDESILAIQNNQLYPLKPGTATITAVYANAEAEAEITVTPSLTGIKVDSLKGEKEYVLANAQTALDLSTVQFQANFNDLTSGVVMGDELTWTSDNPAIQFEDGTLIAQQKGVYTITGTKDSASVSMMVIVKNTEDPTYVLYEEKFDSLTDGTLPAGWTIPQSTRPVYPERIVDDFDGISVLSGWQDSGTGAYTFSLNNEITDDESNALRVDYDKQTQSWAFMTATVDPNAAFFGGNQLSFKVNGNVDLIVKYEEVSGAHEQKFKVNTDGNWETITWDTSAIKDDITDTRRILIFAAPGEAHKSGTFYLDDIKVFNSEEEAADNAAVKSGAFELNALAEADNPARVILPSYLSNFGNYTIEADVTHLEANDSARWHSIMYRIQNLDYPYYQMAVRQDATVAYGVEFAERTPANGWKVLDRGSNSEPIDAENMYHYTVTAYENRVQQSINDQIIVDTGLATAYSKGAVGLQANGSRMKVDNIRVTLQLDELPPVPEERYVQVAEPETSISMAPSVVKEIQNANDLAKLSGTALPATIVLHVEQGLKVTDPAGKKAIGTVESVLKTIGNRVIPAFYVKDEASVDELTDYLQTNGWEDAAVISDNGDLVKRARTAYPMIRGIVDFSSAGSSLTEEDLLEIRSETTTSLAKTAILPMNASTKDNVEYLQKRMIVVWAKETANKPDQTIAMHQLITAGVNGIVTSAHEAAIEALKVYSNNVTLIRKPYIIAHRGMPSKAPENTIEGNRLGLDSGADFIENDMYLSKDGHLVIIHDSVLEHSTNGTGNVEDHTLEQLKQLNANKPYPDGFPDVKIPTLEEQIDLARERDRMVMAEIKTSTPDAVDALVRIIKENNAEGLVDVMSFHTSQLKRMSELMPEMPLGLLTGGYANETNVNKSLRDTLKLVQGMNVSFNTSYGGLGKNFMEAAKHRGIIISPWTFNNKNDFIRFMMLGVYGITTDYAFWAEDWAASIKPEQDKHELAKGDSISLSAIVESYKGTKTAISPEVVLLDGEDVVEVNGSKVTAKKPGTAHVLMRYTASFDETNKYDIYTQPVSIKVNGQDGNGGGDDTSDTGSVNQPAKPATPASDRITAKEGKVGAAELQDSFATHSSVKVQFDGGKLELAAAGLLDASQLNGKTLQVTADNVTYSLPLSLIKLDTLAQQLGVNVDDVSIRFTLAKLNADNAAAVQSAVAATGGYQAADPVELEVEAVSKTGKTIPVPFGFTYVARDIVLYKTVDSSKATGVQVVPGTKELRFVPTLFTTKDGKTTATLMRNGNSVYTVIENNRSFADMSGHWAKADVELLANKLIVDGVSENRFDAERPVNRAEFAALLVRSLGVNLAPAQASFSDVSSADWYAEEVSTATEAGILSGYKDGTFRPNNKITREEQAAMLIRALNYVGMDTNVPQAKQGEILSSFKDASQVAWAKAELAAAIQVGLINGMTAETLEPGSFATRAQAAVMLKRFLIKANFIN